MQSPPAHRARLALAVTLAAYAVGTVLASAVTIHAIHRVAHALLMQVAPMQVAPVQMTARAPSRTATLHGSGTDRKAESGRDAVPAASPLRSRTIVRQAAMTPTQEQWARSERGWLAPRARLAQAFGSSSRGLSAPSYGGSYGGRRDWDDDDDRPSPRLGSTYRTMCVRLCDGFYWPISYATTEQRFEHDARACATSCGGQARLFVYRNPGGDIEDMADLSGRPYRRLQTAFLYRTQYVPACKCQPDPWEAASKDRHRMYALAAAGSKGSSRAARNLEERQKKVKPANRAGKTASLPMRVPVPVPVQSGRVAGQPAVPKAAEPRRLAGEGNQVMRLGTAGGQRRSRPAPVFDGPRYGGDPDWRQRILRP